MHPLVTQTAQAAVLSATSNIIAQAITAYRNDTALQLNFTPIFHFILFSIISTPPNCLWQEYLEQSFPGQKEVLSQATEKKTDKKVAKDETKLDVANTVKKFALDQTFGAALNTWLFIAFIRGINGANTQQVWSALRDESIPLWLDGCKVWPLVSLISFTLLPAERRVIFGSLVGVGWGIYLSLLSA